MLIVLCANLKNFIAAVVNASMSHGCVMVLMTVGTVVMKTTVKVNNFRHKFWNVHILAANILCLGELNMGELTFHDMGRTNGVSKKYLPPADDSASLKIDIPTGFAFGNETKSLVYVRLLL